MKKLESSNQVKKRGKFRKAIRVEKSINLKKMESNSILGAYLVKGTIGNEEMPGAPIVHFALVVVPSKHKVTGSVQITQATASGNYSGNVTGLIHATGFGDVTQIVSLTGSIHPDGPEILELPFAANMAINGAWVGKGGFGYGNVHVQNAPVAKTN